MIETLFILIAIVGLFLLAFFNLWRIETLRKDQERVNLIIAETVTKAHSAISSQNEQRQQRIYMLVQEITERMNAIETTVADQQYKNSTSVVSEVAALKESLRELQHHEALLDDFNKLFGKK